MQGGGREALRDYWLPRLRPLTGTALTGFPGPFRGSPLSLAIFNRSSFAVMLSGSLTLAINHQARFVVVTCPVYPSLAVIAPMGYRCLGLLGRPSLDRQGLFSPLRG